MKEVWFVSHYSMPPKYEMRVKTLKYAHYLNLKGYKTKIFTASTLHNTDINLIKSNEQYIEARYEDLDYVHIKCSNYSGNGIKCIRNMMQFAYRFPKVAKHFKKPDVIVADVNCINYKPIYKYCKKNEVQFVIDVRDLWPESIVEHLNYSSEALIIKYLYNKEKKMYKDADDIIFSMEGGKEYIKDHKWETDISLEKIHYINNGIDLIENQENRKKYHIVDNDLLDNKIFKVVYIGSIRRANDIKMLVKIAGELKKRQKNLIKILIYGDGDEKLLLEKECREKNLDNILFKGQVNKKYIPYILEKCNLNLLHSTSIPAYKYGVSLNKSFDYLASGKPILSDIKAEYDYILKNKAGRYVAYEESKIADEIVCFYNMNKKEYYQYCVQGKKVVEQFDYRILSEKLASIISKS